TLRRTATAKPCTASRSPIQHRSPEALEPKWWIADLVCELLVNSLLRYSELGMIPSVKGKSDGMLVHSVNRRCRADRGTMTFSDSPIKYRSKASLASGHCLVPVCIGGSRIGTENLLPCRRYTLVRLSFCFTSARHWRFANSSCDLPVFRRCC
ncbi:hypothetical protein HAX54_050332, partial [Datura stramonium]|nr:hypothetical protein [Datura stramonium]